MSDNGEGLRVNGQTEKRLRADTKRLLIKCTYLQVSIQTVEGCKISPAWGRLNAMGPGHELKAEALLALTVWRG